MSHRCVEAVQPQPCVCLTSWVTLLGTVVEDHIQQSPFFSTLSLPVTTKHSHGPRGRSGSSNRVVRLSLASVSVLVRRELD